MPIDHAFAVFWIETILNKGASIAQVEHELAGPTDNFIRTLCDDWHFSDRSHVSELFIVFVILT